jgi:hypothetical protein
MAGDSKAERFVQENNIVGLFRYLGPMWIVTCMEILEDMLIKGKFYPNPDRYRAELLKAGINVERMEVTMAAALHKVGRSITWEKFEEMHGPKMARLPAQQQGEIKNFWLAKPVPGLVGDARTAQEGDYWSLTNTWEFEFEPDLEVGSYRLPNGTVIPLPSRGKYWPKRATKAKFMRSKSRLGKIRYDVLLVPTGYDTYWLTKFLIDQGAESLLSKSAAILIGGIVAPILAGAATVLVPNETGETSIWKTECNEMGIKNIPIYGITSGFNK